MNYPKIAQQIIDLKDADLKLREELIQAGLLHNGYHEEMEKMHKVNAEALNTIIEQIGYPTVEQVGKAANEAAWLIIQHAIGQPIFMKKCARLLESAVHQQQANPINLAYLQDRIATFESKAQLYGTQFDWDENGHLSPQPFDDLDKVNQRRKSIGLNSLEAQTQIIRNNAIKENELPPKDFQERKEKYDQWRKKVGWIK